MSIKEIKITPLEAVTQEEFAPYGQIMGRTEGEPYETLEILKYWSKNADLGPDNEKVDGGLLVCNKSGRTIKYLERHPETAENFIPIEGECIFVMAPADNSKDKPDVARLRAFYLNGKLGVALHKGTWHWPPIPLEETVKLVLVRKGTLWEETELKDLKDLGVDELKVTL
jgi:ureidoglycolate lyase